MSTRPEIDFTRRNEEKYSGRKIQARTFSAGATKSLLECGLKGSASLEDIRPSGGYFQAPTLREPEQYHRDIGRSENEGVQDWVILVDSGKGYWWHQRATLRPLEKTAKQEGLRQCVYLPSVLPYERNSFLNSHGLYDGGHFVDVEHETGNNVIVMKLKGTWTQSQAPPVTYSKGSSVKSDTRKNLVQLVDSCNDDRISGILINLAPLLPNRKAVKCLEWSKSH
ncbi:uncharacterized protein EDB93DRAFT_1108337 [Suillus bovinus]|uniref:uncharacterized protein n=1 Tax=Suillus bovinus TaxID=48563 RepID=UPI001B8821F3|nr:uncharacterized protein EDB93DRAFT_1108337 [Suillus bovinus]KAG2130668.1 hypothetical protein EDB93DRAFT_1108337 [Suillus bovinus]